MIREQHLRLDDASRVSHLLRCHGIRLVARQESHVDILDVCHLWNILRITCNVDTQSVDSDDEPIVASLRMELCSPFRIVIRWHRLHMNIRSNVHLITVSHHLPVAQHLSTPRVRNHLRTLLGKRSNRLFIKVIPMLVCHEDIVSLRHRGIVGSGRDIRHRINLYLLPVVAYPNATVFNTVEHHLFPSRCFEHVHALCLSRFRGLTRKQRHNA